MPQPSPVDPPWVLTLSKCPRRSEREMGGVMGFARIPVQKGTLANPTTRSDGSQKTGSYSVSSLTRMPLKRTRSLIPFVNLQTEESFVVSAIADPMGCWNPIDPSLNVTSFGQDSDAVPTVFVER